MARGFLEFQHYGHQCFIRDQYDEAHQGEDELSRLEDALGMSFSDINMAMYYCLTHALYLLYRLESDQIDQELLKGRDPWMRFRNGWVHIVTGEFVPSSIRPSYDSYPCWKIDEPIANYFDPHSSVQLSGLVGIGAAIFTFLANVLGGQR